jgi:hypothetical protein
MTMRWKWVAGVAAVAVVAAAVGVGVYVRDRDRDDDLPRVVPIAATTFQAAGSLLGDTALTERAARAWRGQPSEVRNATYGEAHVLWVIWAGPRDGASEVLLALDQGTVFRYRERPGQAGAIQRLPNSVDTDDDNPLALSGGGWLLPRRYLRERYRLVRRDAQGAWSDVREAQIGRDGVLEAGDDAYLFGPHQGTWLLRAGTGSYLQIGPRDIHKRTDEWLAFNAALDAPDAIRLAVGALDAAMRALPEPTPDRGYAVDVITTRPLAPVGPFTAIAVTHRDPNDGTRVAAAYGTGTTTVLPGRWLRPRSPGYDPLLTGGWLTTGVFVAVGDRRITSITVDGQTVQGNVAAFPSVAPGSTPAVTGTEGTTHVVQMA